MTKSGENVVGGWKSWMWKFSIVVVSVAVTLALFVYLNRVQPELYIDEEFHFRQTLHYVHGDYLEWDPKITTLPGLYLITVLILSPFRSFDIFCMRSINFLGTLVNFYLIHSIIEKNDRREDKDIPINSWIRFALTLALAHFPPLYFFSFLYYTDVLSMTFVLLTMLMHLRGRYRTAAFAGIAAILMRQTNVIWVAVLAAERAVDLLEAQTPRSIEALISKNIHNTFTHGKIVWNNIRHHTTRGSGPFVSFVIQMLKDLRAYALVILAFGVFVIANGGIVLGDRSAHVATLHVPQIFYYSVFCGLFAWPYMLPHCRGFLRWIAKKWIVTSCLLAVATIIVHSNTLVHPYVLADNRHYVFYVWNRFMGPHRVLRYLLLPIYGFAIYAHLACLRNLRFLSQLIYVGAVCVVLIPQLLLEPRYFIVPYLYLRLNMSRPTKWQITCELITTAMINFLQFYIFANKSFYWSDIPHPQRISW